MDASKSCASVNLRDTTPSSRNLVLRAVSIACCVSSDRSAFRMPLVGVTSLHGTKTILCANPCDCTFL